MKLVMTLLVRDEQDILEANIDFHLHQGVDFIIATDNLSVDRTPAILERYQRMGKLLRIEERSDDYSQHRWVTRMARMAAVDHGADWVINNDADEFWWPTQPGNLKDALARVAPEIGAVRVPRYNFPVTGQYPAHLPFHAAMTWRDTRSENPLGRPLPPKACHRGWADVEVAQGNHGISRQGQAIAASDGWIDILHFPMRSYAQFENKIRLGGAAYARNTELSPGVGNTWRQLYADWQAGKLLAYYEAKIPTQEQLHERIASGRYVRDDRLSEVLGTPGVATVAGGCNAHQPAEEAGSASRTGHSQEAKDSSR